MVTSVSNKLPFWVMFDGLLNVCIQLFNFVFNNVYVFFNNVYLIVVIV